MKPLTLLKIQTNTKMMSYVESPSNGYTLSQNGKNVTKP